ncbi:hypothetical protein C8Q73DRAFT_512013 [Cubamyces lactineus]|nr:hypothetical protein C8Q73DRAFT_512013 [Cubamyces lactineus]
MKCSVWGSPPRWFALRRHGLLSAQRGVGTAQGSSASPGRVRYCRIGAGRSPRWGRRGQRCKLSLHLLARVAAPREDIVLPATARSRCVCSLYIS